MKTTRIFQALLGLVLTISTSSHAAPPFAEFIDPNPNPGNQFGATVVPLSTGNVVITSPFDDAGGTDAGAVYLFNGATGALISTLTGSNSFDRVGWEEGPSRPGVMALTNGNFVVISSRWDNGNVVDAGAVTWGSGTTGVSGVVSAANSLVGTQANDGVGNPGIVPLRNGNYVVRSTFWDNGGIADAGAVTWGNGTTGASGSVSSSNSLVGGSSNDRVGSSNVVPLSNGNYVVGSGLWDNGSATDAGAATWGSGTTGVSGLVSPSNSLVGSQSNDGMGGIGVVANGNNYLVASSTWNSSAGAVVWGSGLSGVSGTVSSANALVGKIGDRVSSNSIQVLPNGNYVVFSVNWKNGTKSSAGAVTWGNGATGITGIVDSSNSLVGTNTSDGVGSDLLTVLGNGNYVIRSPGWSSSRGAVTWCNGTTGLVGAVSSANSLVGVTIADNVGQGGITTLTSGNYVVTSPLWNNGGIADAGAATWCNGETGTSGQVSSTNSLVGMTASDKIGSAFVRALTNGNYVVASPLWDHGAVTDAGAVTRGNGIGGISGPVTSANSLVGTTALDKVGGSGAWPLLNGNYVVLSPLWNNGAATGAGAATWGDGNIGITGAVSAGNSLVGSQAGDNVGSGVVSLAGGNYVVQSPSWDNGGNTNVGAATWGNGLSGIAGAVSSDNSLVGGSSGDAVGTVQALPNSNYLVFSSGWDNGAAADAGAVTWGNGASGVSGPVGAGNSLVGSEAGDAVGSGFGATLPNGKHLICSPNWDNGSLVNAGAVTWVDGTTGWSGVISSANSMLGASAASGLRLLNQGFPDPVSFDGSTYRQKLMALDEVNGTFFGRFLSEGGGVVRVGSQDNGFAPAPTIGSPTVSALASEGASLGGTITSDNGSPITARGVVFSPTSLNSNPRPNGAGVQIVLHPSNSTGSFSVTVEGLLPETSYSFSAFATNSVGTSYTLPTSTFTTLSPPGSAEIAIEHAGSDVSTGSTHPFGPVATGGYLVRTFSILNTGTADLTLSGIPKIAVSGSADFIVTSQPASPDIAPGGSDSFTVRFTPTGSGMKSATLSIANNDDDENPFVIELTGTATTASALFVTAVTTGTGLSGDDALPTAIPFNDGVENLLKYAFNMNLAGPDSATMAAGGAAGLPTISQEGSAEAGVLRFEFVGRIGSGLIYTPKKSTSLDSSEWVSLTESATIEPIDDEWERVIYEEPSDPADVPTCFGRVEVSIP